MKRMLLILLVFLSTSLLAKESGFLLSTAFVGMNMDYREYGVTDANGYGVYDGAKSLEKILDSEKSNSNIGPLVGVDIYFGYKKVLESGHYGELGLNFMIVSGETEYVGSYNGSPDGYGSVVERTKNIVIDTDVDYKFSYVLNDSFTVSYGMGVGYRLWRRELSATQIEVYKWMSVRPHIGGVYSMSRFSLGMDLEYQYALNPQMTILGNGNSPDLTVNLGGANIVQVSIPFEVAISDSIDLFLKYTYENQIIGKSNQITLVNGRLWEPRSEANNNYIKIGATFKF